MKQASSLIPIVIGVVAAFAVVTYLKNQQEAPNPEPTATASPTATSTSSSPLNEQGVQVASPLPNALIESPLTVTGTATGDWFFEGQFPLCILDGSNTEIACGQAHAQGEWMTTDSIPFTATFTFATPTTDTGKLVLKKDNPSGLPANDKSVSLPIRFR